MVPRTNPLSAVQQRQEYEQRENPRYTSQIGDTITIQLPDEATRAEVVRVISASRVIGRLLQFTTANKSHNYKKDSFVAAEYRRGGMNQMGWHEIPQDQLDAATEPLEPEEEYAEPREMVEGDFMLPRTRKAR